MRAPAARPSPRDMGPPGAAQPAAAAASEERPASQRRRGQGAKCEGRCLMPRTAIMESPAHSAADDEVTTASLDELVQRGRAQGRLSLAELRATFQTANITAAEGRSILRELTEAGVRLADEPADAGAPGAARAGDAPRDRPRPARL